VERMLPHLENGCTAYLSISPGEWPILARDPFADEGCALANASVPHLELVGKSARSFNAAQAKEASDATSSP